jgi:cytochrome c-type biogenesis protein CcmE
MSRKLLIGTLLAGAGALALVFGLGKSPAIYSYGVSDFLSRSLWDQRVRVQGTLAHGTMCRVAADCGYRFTLQGRPTLNADGAPEAASSHDLSVSYDSCVVPDTFRDVPWLDLEIVVEGELCQSCHDFKATQVIAKCSGKYEMNRAGGPYSVTPPMPLCKARTPRM